MKFNCVLCVACRMALGKLRRVTNIARALRMQHPDAVLTLLADSGPAGISRALSQEEIHLFDRVETVPAADMVSSMKSMDVDIVIIDTMKLRDLHEVDALLCLILREAVSGELPKFHMAGNRLYDLIILPHPAGHWSPDPAVIGAKRIEPVGWIYRSPDSETRSLPGTEKESPTLLITTGGGSGEDRGNDIHSDIQHLIARLRQVVEFPFKIVQVVGPKDRNRKSLEGADEIIEPGPKLHLLFPAADLVISAAGYNSVLELATTQVPALLVPVPRYTDDQLKRAREWGKKLGMSYSAEKKEEAIQWMADVLKKRSRRAAVDVGASGADAAAELISKLASTRAAR